VRAAAARVWIGGRADCGATVGAAAGGRSACWAIAPRAHTEGLAAAGGATHLCALGAAQRTARRALWFRLPAVRSPAAGARRPARGAGARARTRR